MTDRTILIVEDEDMARSLMAMLVRKAGFAVLAVRSGAECLEAAASLAPTAVLMDIRLGEECGLELCRRLRRMPALAEVPVVFVTAYTSAEVMRRLGGLRRVGLISKPFMPATFMQRLGQCLSEIRMGGGIAAPPAHRLPSASA
ncbi:MAG TPA: response regulator [Azospirillaceae bacterium]|nr:response regulator [Azospirillaceae bacterium]